MNERRENRELLKDQELVGSEQVEPICPTGAMELDPFGHAEHSTDQLDESWQALAQELFGESEDNRDALLEEFKAAAAQLDPPHLVLPSLDWNGFYLKMLRAGGFTVQGALRVLHAYFTNIRDHPEYFTKALPSLALSLLKQNVHAILPHRDKHGRRVYIYRTGTWNPAILPTSENYCAGFMLCELLSLEPRTQISGVTVVVDGAGFGLRHVRSISISDARCTAALLQGAFPLWFRAIHVVNAPKVFYIAYALIRPFLSKRVTDSIIFHDSIGSLHQHVSAEILPEELGGHQGPIEKIVDLAIQHLNTLEEYFYDLKYTYGYKQ